MLPPFFTSQTVPEDDHSQAEQSTIFLDNKGGKGDMYIIAGYEWNRKMFKVHTSILKDRCEYFKMALSNKCIRKYSDGIMIFHKEDISPKIFKLILDYIYTGEVSTTTCEDVNILEFIIAADEMLLPQLVSYLETLLIDKYLKRSSPEIEGWVFCLITINKEPFLTRFEERARITGFELFKNIIPSNFNTEIEPKVYINALLEVHNMYKNMITEFRGNMSFTASLNKAFREIVNRNHVSGSSTTMTPEFLAQFCDSLLRKINTEDNDLENAMTIYEYIEDKDIFQKFYSMMLAKRLINGTSVSEIAEYSVIAKLKETTSFEYTSKLYRMFTDIKSSKALTDQFKKCISSFCAFTVYSSVDFSFLVLNAASWPIQPLKTGFIMPEELEENFQQFKTFYQNNHSGRKLNLLFHLSKGELINNYCKKAYTFVASTYQMGILLQYNKNMSYTFEELKQKTDLNEYVLADHLKVLIETKILKISNGTKVGDPLSCYELNMNFESKKNRIQLNVQIKSERNNETQRTVEDRMFLLQAAILRVMKPRKKIRNVVLVNEVIAQLSHRFKPKIHDIKKCMDILTEKGYIETRDGMICRI
ncbi:12441_t:CDS:10 [Cetraspora pellucida]|uniref:12441_t:CDS:1 n=1 Tax=Cetraspora pellucida TaxID=1433469 RepID=A0A9N9BBC0_9GLOM|nr:12441_t:CDS:10 [Cetraspora pellucida]